MYKIIHNQDRRDRVPIDRNNLVICLRVHSDSAHEANVQLCHWNRQLDDPQSYNVIKMKLITRSSEYDYYEGIISTTYPSSYIKYIFKIEDSMSEVFWDYYGERLTFSSKHAFEYLYTNALDVIRPVKWLENAVFYQIFPERFYNGNTVLNPEVTCEWDAEPTRENFMGGDLSGITKKLDYLVGLGVNALYLNPIFQAISNHKYDTTNYYKIDQNFGTNLDFKEFVEECHKRDIRVILDGVFNHCGDTFPFFEEALNDINSKYRKWFYFDDIVLNENEKLEYECVGYYDRMPKFDYSNREVRDYFIDVGEFWMKEYNIDGWRLDVADEISYSFWYEFRNAIKTINPDALLLGETWGEKPDMLLGDQMDSVMNYLFMDAVKEYIAEESISTSQFDERLNRITMVYSRNVRGQLFNLIGSHDTERFYTSVNEDNEKYKIAMTLLLMYRGVPSIYYGDEIPLTGKNDPGCRGTIDWSNNANAMREYIQKLISIRHSKEAIRVGDFTSNVCDNKKSCYGFIRSTDLETMCILVNLSNQEQIIDLPINVTGVKIKELLSGKEGVMVDLGAIDVEEFHNSDINSYIMKSQICIGANSSAIYEVCKHE